MTHLRGALGKRPAAVPRVAMCGETIDFLANQSAELLTRGREANCAGVRGAVTGLGEAFEGLTAIDFRSDAFEAEANVDQCFASGIEFRDFRLLEFAFLHGLGFVLAILMVQDCFEI